MITLPDVRDRMAAADLRLWIDWMDAVASIAEDPYGASITSLGDATLMHVHAAPIPYYNRALSVTDPHRLSGALAYFNERFTPCRVDVVPWMASSRLLSRLNDLGLRPSGFQSNLVAEIERLDLTPPPGIEVREVGAGELTIFCRLYDRAYYGSKELRRLARFRIDALAARFGRPGWRFFQASVGGLPAGGGVLHMADGIATLAGGATVSTMRGRGCQRALLAARLRTALAEGCRLAVSRCVAGSTSQRNMERIGLRTAYTKSLWQYP